MIWERATCAHFQLLFYLPGPYADKPKLQVDSLGRTLSRLLEQIHQHQEGGLSLNKKEMCFSSKVERPDVAMGIHPGLHADGVFEFWEPTLDLLLEENIVTVFTMFSQEEYEMSLVRLDGMFAKYSVNEHFPKRDNEQLFETQI